MSALSKIRLVRSPLSGDVMLARFGKDPCLALEKRDALNEFLRTIVAYAFEGAMPEPGAVAEQDFGGGDEQFVLTLTRKPIEPRP